MLGRFSAPALILLITITAPASFLARGRQNSTDGVAQPKPARDPNQPIDEDYTKKIREYTTEPFFSSPLVDYLPASSTVPTPMAVLGDIAGAPGKLPYSQDVYKYMRMLEKSHSSGESLFDWRDRRRPRDDCSRGHF